jgi:hypothetical protein
MSNNQSMKANNKLSALKQEMQQITPMVRANPACDLFVARLRGLQCIDALSERLSSPPFVMSMSA